MGNSTTTNKNVSVWVDPNFLGQVLESAGMRLEYLESEVLAFETDSDPENAVEVQKTVDFLKESIQHVEEALFRATNSKIMATFVPQQWINDYAVEVDGRKDFDATEQVLKLPLVEIRCLTDNRGSSDALVPAEIRDSHTGPFYVVIEQPVQHFFKAHGYDQITQEAVDNLRPLWVDEEE